MIHFLDTSALTKRDAAEKVDLVPALVRRHPLRGYDAVQLACALAIRAAKVPVTFWCADDVLEAAAAGEGLPTARPG